MLGSFVSKAHKIQGFFLLKPFGHSISFLSLGPLDHSIGLPGPVPEPGYAVSLHSGEVLSLSGCKGSSFGGSEGGYSVMFTCRVEVRSAEHW